MNSDELELRDRYRNASDDELMLLAEQGESEYTETAWRLLRKEMARRRLPSSAPIRNEGVSTNPTGPLTGDTEPVTEDTPALPLSRWGEMPDDWPSSRRSDAALKFISQLDPEDKEAATTPREAATAPRQPYTLCWLFVILSLVNAYPRRLDLPSALAMNAVSLAQGLAAASRRWWGWYFLVFTIPLGLGLGLAFALPQVHQPGLSEGARVGLVFVSAMGVLFAGWFVYFYRRRAMFGSSAGGG